MTSLQSGPPFDSVQLVNITPISLWFMILMTIVTGVYKPTFTSLGGAHIVPSGDVKIAIENGPVEIVKIPMKHGDFP